MKASHIIILFISTNVFLLYFYCVQQPISILFGPIQSHLVQFHPLRSYPVYYFYIGLIRSIMSYSINIGPIRSTLVPFCHYVHFGPIWSFLSALVLFGPLGLIRGHFGAIRSTSVHLLLFSRFWSYSVLSVCFGSIRSYLGISVHFGPL